MALHIIAEMETQGIVEILPTLTVSEELVAVVDGQEEWTIELPIIAAVAAFHTTVVAFAALGVACELSIERLQELIRQLTDGLGVVAAKLLPPVSLEGDRRLAPEGSQPHQHQDAEGETVGAVEAMAVGLEPKPGTAITSGPLVAWEALATQMSGSSGAQRPLVQDILSLDSTLGEIQFP